MTKVLISIPEDLLDEVDRLAGGTHRSRSELVREALLRYLASASAYPTPGASPEVREAVAFFRRRPVGGTWDSTREIRRSRSRRKAR